MSASALFCLIAAICVVFFFGLFFPISNTELALLVTLAIFTADTESITS